MAAPGFVGRDATVAAIRALMARGSSRPAVAAVVTGAPGSGKSRLLAEVAAGGSLHRLPAVGGSEPERRVPLAAARELLRALAAAPHEGPRLAALLDGSSPDRVLERLQLLEAAHRCLSELGPVLVVVDDLQWVDETTVALVHYLLRAARVDGTHVVVLAGSRPGQVASRFADAVGRLHLDPHSVLVLRLAALDRGSGVRLARDVNPSLSTQQATQVWERSSGLPFWIIELARAGADERQLGAALQARLAGLSADAASLAEALAVAGTPRQRMLFDRVLGWPAQRCDVAVAELVDEGLAVRTGPVVRLVHDLVRDVILAAIPTAELRRTHARLSRWLEEVAGDDVALLSEALSHRRAADLPSAQLGLLVLNAPRRSLLDVDDLAALARDAESESGPEADALEGAVARAAGELGHPRLALDRWLALRARLPAAPERSWAFLHASRAALALGDRTQAQQLLRDAGAGRSADPVLAVELDAQASEMAGNSRAESERPMLRAAAAARDLVRGAGGSAGLAPAERHAVLAALRAEFYFALRTERPITMLRLAEELETTADSAAGRLGAGLDAALALRLLGRYPEAERRCRDARLAAVRATLPVVSFHAGYLLAGTLYHLGRLTEARAAVHDVVAAADRAPVVVPSWLSVPWMRSLAQEIEVSLGGWSAARPALEDLVAAEREPHFRLQIRLVLGQWAARLGAPREAAFAGAALLAAADDADAAGCARCASEVAVRAAEGLARLGRSSEARGLLDRWDAEHDAPPVGQVAFWRLRAEALIAADRDAASAVAALEAVRDRAHAMGAGLEEVWSDLDLGRSLADLDRDRAVAALRSATRQAQRLDASSELRLAGQLLRGLGVRAWRPTPRVAAGDGAGLTEREAEIVTMVATGASNPEIAEAIFLSRKTVERHVSNIFAKTGVRNRAELAARLGQMAAAPPT